VQEHSYQHPMAERAFQAKASFGVLSLLRVMHEAVRCYDGDLEAFVIYLAVACASSGGAWRRLEAIVEPGPWPPPEAGFHAISRRAIAASTGLPRETVRRKIAAFIDEGLLIAQGSYVRIPPDLLENAQIRDFARMMGAEFTRTAAQLARIPSPH